MYARVLVSQLIARLGEPNPGPQEFSQVNGIRYLLDDLR